MPFFQNVFDFEFRPSMFGADRHYQTGWKLKANTNRSDYILSGLAEPFDLTGNQDLTINYCYDPAFVNYGAMTVTLTGADLTAVTAVEIAGVLNQDANFKEYFICTTYAATSDVNGVKKLLIRTKKSRQFFRSYISNTGAETKIQFNRNAPIAELPTLFEQYTIANRFAYPSFGSERVIKLNPADPYEAFLITNAGFDPTLPKADWQLLAGSSDIYWFYKKTYDGSGRLTEEIKYPAGATAGMAAKKTYYKYSGVATVPSEVCETPHVLATGDLIAP